MVHEMWMGFTSNPYGEKNGTRNGGGYYDPPKSTPAPQNHEIYPPPPLDSFFTTPPTLIPIWFYPPRFDSNFKIELKKRNEN